MPRQWTADETWENYLIRHDFSDELVGGISEQTQNIIGATEQLERQVALASRHMQDMAGGIAELNSSFQWGFGHVLTTLGGMRQTLEELVQIAKTPVQTWAYNQFEIARDAFRQGLYVECLDALDKAINGDITSPGYKLEWRFHQMQGVIRLGFFGCDLDLIDLAAAEQSFLLAGRYARVDRPADAATALMSAGWSAFLQGKLADALKYSEQAVALHGRLGEAVFQIAKINMASGEVEQALPFLRRAIEMDRGYIVKAVADNDFRKHEAKLNDFMDAYRREVFGRLQPRVQDALSHAEEMSAEFSEIRDCHEILDRWRSMLSGNWGLIDLIEYFDRCPGERDKVTTAIESAAARLRRERLAWEQLQQEKAAAIERERLAAVERERVAELERERLAKERLDREHAKECEEIEHRFFDKVRSLLRSAVTLDQTKRVQEYLQYGKSEIEVSLHGSFDVSGWRSLEEEVLASIDKVKRRDKNTKSLGFCDVCGDRLSVYELGRVCSTCKKRSDAFEQAISSVK